MHATPGVMHPMAAAGTSSLPRHPSGVMHPMAAAGTSSLPHHPSLTTMTTEPASGQFASFSFSPGMNRSAFIAATPTPTILRRCRSAYRYFLRSSRPLTSVIATNRWALCATLLTASGLRVIASTPSAPWVPRLAPPPVSGQSSPWVPHLAPPPVSGQSSPWVPHPVPPHVSGQSLHGSLAHLVRPLVSGPPSLTSTASPRFLYRWLYGQPRFLYLDEASGATIDNGDLHDINDAFSKLCAAFGAVDDLRSASRSFVNTLAADPSTSGTSGLRSTIGTA